LPRIAYVEKTFRKSSLAVIQQANKILREYGAAGFDLTLRQLYYQFVARDLIPNTQKSYKRLGSIINDARLAGLIDWSYIVDRTRNLRALGHWDEPSDIIESAAASFRVDLWETQPYYCEAWIEKDALVGVLERICNELDIPFFSCRGYTSQSELWGAAQRIIRETGDGRSAVIFHLGDHDPSGIDMTRDITERFRMFGAKVDVRRLALNMDQVEQYDPPPNPAKLTDSRCAGYMAEHGSSSWELDALNPSVISDLIRSNAEELIDEDAWKERKAAGERGRELLGACAGRWDEVEDCLAS
jgi:hypothetical protein